MGRDDSRERQARFLSWLSHELRTPLASVLMLAELLAESATDPRQAGYARKVSQAAVEMRTLLERVSELARIDGGRLELDLEDLDPGVLAARLEEELRSRARAAGCELRVSRGELPATLRCDGERLLDVAVRLLRVVLAGGEEPVALRLGVPVGGGTPREGLVLALGPLGSERGETLFELRRGAGEEGLDLWIARALAQRLGGEVTLERGVGGEGTLVLRLPISA